MAQPDPLQFAVEAARLASDNKCEDVVVLDLRGRSSVTDFFVIATGTSDRQMASTADHVEEYARSHGVRLLNGRRLDSPAWVLLDFIDVVIHVFDREHREFYDLELLWGDAPRVDWQQATPWTTSGK